MMMTVSEVTADWHELCGRPLPELANNQTRGAVSIHTTAQSVTGLHSVARVLYY